MRRSSSSSVTTAVVLPEADEVDAELVELEEEMVDAKCRRCTRLEIASVCLSRSKTGANVAAVRRVVPPRFT